MNQRFIPENVIKGKRIFIAKRRNVIEGLLIGSLAGLAILCLPRLLLKVKVIMAIPIFLLILLFLAIGIKGLSLSEYLICKARMKKYKNAFSYRRPSSENLKITKGAVIVDGKVTTIKENQTIIDRTRGLFKI